MTELVQLYAQIALLRRGPQDLPASYALLAATIVAYFAVNFLVSSVIPPHAGPWLKHLLLDIAFTIVWYAALMRLVGRPERFLQTTTAVFGYQAILSPLLVLSGWLIRRFEENTVWQLPVSMLALVLLVWIVAAGTHILRAALEWPTLACVGLVILQILAGQLLLFYLFPIAR